MLVLKDFLEFHQGRSNINGTAKHIPY